MRTKSDKVQKFLVALDNEPKVSVNRLAKRCKISPGYAYKLAKERQVQNEQVLRIIEDTQSTNFADLFPGVEVISMDAGVDANKEQVGGDHYRKNAIQPWDYIVRNNLGYLEGNIVKYVSRWKEKGGKQDLEKARHYLDKLLETA